MVAGAMLAAVFCFPSVFALFATNAPVLVEEPTDTVAIPVGLIRSANLSCRAISYSNASVIQIKWYKDDVAVEMGSLPSYNITDNSLVVATTDPKDNGSVLEGTFYCVISNVFGAVRSRSALVKTQHLDTSVRPVDSIFYSTETVVVAHLVYMQKPLLQWLIGCNRQTLICPSVSCHLWHHVSVVRRLLLFSLLRLTYNGIKTSIPDCATTDTVTVSIPSTPPAQLDSVQFNGLSFVPRKTINETQYISVEVGGSAILYCISNHPNSTYAWIRDGSPVQVANHSKYSFTIDGVLQIHDVVQTDGGLYNCSATAVYPGYGQHTRNTTTNLTVYSLPSVNLTLAGQSDTTCNIINSTILCRVHPIVSYIIMVCHFDGSAPLLVQILYNAVILLEQNVTDNQRSMEHAATNSSSGVYQCIANNPYGSVQTSLYVTVQEDKPTCSSPVQTNIGNDTTIDLKTLAIVGWTVAGLLLCVNVIIIILWIRHHVITEHKLSHSADKQEEMRENTAYNIIPIGHIAGRQKQNTGYEEVRTMGSDSEHHQHETPGKEDCMVATNTSL